MGQCISRSEFVPGEKLAPGHPGFICQLTWRIEHTRCAAQVPALAGRKITPHVLRHTTACHLVFAGVDINTVRAWLGHSSIDTTNIYAEINLKMRTEAMALCDVAEPAPGRPRKEDKDLMAFLNSY